MERSLKKLEKSIGFMDRMVKLVFYGTFFFTIAVMVFAWFFEWENILYQLIDKWFGIMVGELLIMGVIQIGKQITDILKKKLNIEESEEETDDQLDGHSCCTDRPDGGDTYCGDSAPSEIQDD